MVCLFCVCSNHSNFYFLLQVWQMCGKEDCFLNVWRECRLICVVEPYVMFVMFGLLAFTIQQCWKQTCALSLTVPVIKHGTKCEILDTCIMCGLSSVHQENMYFTFQKNSYFFLLLEKEKYKFLVFFIWKVKCMFSWCTVPLIFPQISPSQHLIYLCWGLVPLITCFEVGVLNVWYPCFNWKDHEVGLMVSITVSTRPSELHGLRTLQLELSSTFKPDELFCQWSMPCPPFTCSGCASTSYMNLILVGLSSMVRVNSELCIGCSSSCGSSNPHGLFPCHTGN